MTTIRAEVLEYFEMKPGWSKREARKLPTVPEVIGMYRKCANELEQQVRKDVAEQRKATAPEHFNRYSKLAGSIQRNSDLAEGCRGMIADLSAECSSRDDIIESYEPFLEKLAKYLEQPSEETLADLTGNKDSDMRFYELLAYLPAQRLKTLGLTQDGRPASPHPA
ncbi:MAG TPA: hypothetical protein VHB73_05605 [Alphaproteobacteria bacterium]|nr:hypothetical protein [Alphaproteobacteria bacterium]